MANVVTLPYTYWPDPDKGRPVFSGFVYVGEPDLDPEKNPKVIFAIEEDGSQVSLKNPFRTSAGGVSIDQNGNTITVGTDGDYSLRVRRVNGQGQPGSIAYELSNATASFLSIAQQNEQQTLISGQTTVTFDVINTNFSNFYLCGDDVDNGRLCTPQDYTITNATTIELTESYPEGTVLLGSQSETTVENNPVSKNRETRVLADGQQVVTFTTNNTTSSDIYIAGNDVDSGILVPNVDYLIDTASQITLTDSYPAGAIVLAVEILVS